MYDIFYLKKENELDGNLRKLRKRFPLIKVINDHGNKYETLINIKKKSLTRFFWVIDLEMDYQVIDNFNFDYDVPTWDSKYVHVWKKRNIFEEITFGNVYLIPKDYSFSKNEARHFFFMDKKEMLVEASGFSYEILKLKTDDNIYESIINFQNECNTSMFWVIASDCELTTELTYVVPDHDKEYIHQWTASNNEHLRLNLIPKYYVISKREAENLFFISKKIMDESICKEEYDIIFISYNEPNAENNWVNLQERFPKSKRVHGVKGIHNAHIQAALNSKTSMFWVVDGDAQLVEDFNLDFVVDPWDKDCVFVWKSKNPINNLVYGYGGVKLLPKELTLNLDTSTVDMTTSISSKFKPIYEISNITVFNTDPFNTWKSSFRECVKLSSKSIDGQINEETLERLDTWCTVGIDQLFGKYAIDGAIFGREYGLMYSTDKVMLSKINDWEWLTIEFNKRYNGIYK